MDITVGNTQLTSISIPPINGSYYGREFNYPNSFLSTSSTITVTLDYNNNGNPSALAYLDYISLIDGRHLENT